MVMKDYFTFLKLQDRSLAIRCSLMLYQDIDELVLIKKRTDEDSLNTFYQKNTRMYTPYSLELCNFFLLKYYG